MSDTTPKRSGRRRFRPSAERTVEHARWVRDRRGNWRYKIDTPTEAEYCARVMRERHGFFRGARVLLPGYGPLETLGASNV